MTKFFLTAFSIFVLFSHHSIAQNFLYPATPKQPVADTIFGSVVVDNYRWMEDMNSQQVKDWLKMQADYTNYLLDKIPGRNALLEDYKKLDKLAPTDIPYVRREANRYFYKKTLAGENVGKIYYREGKAGKEILLFDPATYTKDKTEAVTFYFIPSKDGKKIALILGQSGVEVFTIRVMDVGTKKFYEEIIYPSYDLAGWSPDSKGFIYTFPQTKDHLSNDLLKDQRSMYHKVGTDPKKDQVILSRLNNADLELKPEDLLFVGYSPDGKYLVANIWSDTQDNNRKFFAPASDLLQNKIHWKLLVKAEDQVRDGVFYNDEVFLLTRKNAPKYKVVRISINDLDITHAKTIIPESDYIIQFITRSRDFLFIHKSDGINTSVDQYNLTSGEIHPVKLPLKGYIWVQTFDAKTNDCILHVSSWKQPTTRYDYNPVIHKTWISPFNNTVNYPGVNDLMVEEIEVQGHDGVKIPLTLIYNKNIKKDGKIGRAHV